MVGIGAERSDEEPRLDGEAATAEAVAVQDAVMEHRAVAALANPTRTGLPDGGYKEIKVPRPDIPEIMPDLSRLPTSLRNELPDYLRNEG
ncbi:hypothetical protein [Streptomyces sp. NPDC056191]|uniref:hypothetical protein n=1 Tax=Streptomyces sp. NPDC056191 TaxID=3345742 RepID=UPI0035DE37C3